MKDSTNSKGFVFWSLVGAVLVVAVWAIAGLLTWRSFESPELRGTFGDMFGAVNALFSGLAFLGVIVAIILQKMELEEQRREIRDSRLAHQQSARALEGQLESSTLQVEIDALNHIVDSLQTRIEGMVTRTSHIVIVEDQQKLDALKKERT
ncbi:hypothetical protein, partial [Roseimaritima sediminicola]|uniref:hypothetical protein n=1 Tax=Roseimaritima sediminicola TaxID=2662066 RepID=UPI00192A2997